MGARDSFAPAVRGMSQEAAMVYLGVKRRTFESLRHRLHPVPLGTSLVYDVRDLDKLFDSLKVEAALAAANDDAHRRPATASAERLDAPASVPSSGRAAVKGTTSWVNNVASIKSARERGESTVSTGASAFKAVSELIKKRKSG